MDGRQPSFKSRVLKVRMPETEEAKKKLVTVRLE
jgi:hypothetical protein